ncbi:uncharacterized protein LOC122018510 isoform X2 [Zingiber officinale]|uniref:uncharacterized protein LOC122018510 isoform X2 n=1 Tax=Zingiber officinale TaxID=94328 RepID=UPI001C4AD8C2|nr:uncharacterized protein LOC122018510 isoform X2 [Zingiber officinale]
MIDDYYIIAFAFSEGAPRNPSWYLRLCPRPPLVAFSSSIPTSQSSSSLSQRTADAVVDEKNYFQWRNPIDRSGKHCHSCSWLATWSPVSDSPSKMPLFLQREKAFGWAFARDDHIRSEHFDCLLVCACSSTLLAVWTF